MASLQRSKWSDNKQCTVEIRRGVLIENLIVILLPESGRKYSHTNSYNFAR